MIDQVATRKRHPRSAAQNIDAMFFAPQAPLHDEFENLYAALFEHHERHLKVIRALARKQSGLTRKEIIHASKMPTAATSARSWMSSNPRISSASCNLLDARSASLCIVSSTNSRCSICAGWRTGANRCMERVNGCIFIPRPPGRPGADTLSKTCASRAHRRRRWRRLPR
jgi:hypothetical protein